MDGMDGMDGMEINKAISGDERGGYFQSGTATTRGHLSIFDCLRCPVLPKH